jgi:hypothetical protein
VAASQLACSHLRYHCLFVVYPDAQAACLKFISSDKANLSKVSASSSVSRLNLRGARVALPLSYLLWRCGDLLAGPDCVGGSASLTLACVRVACKVVETDGYTKLSRALLMDVLEAHTEAGHSKKRKAQGLECAQCLPFCGAGLL